MMHHIIEGIEKLPQIVKTIGCKKILLVAGSSYHHLAIKEIVNSLNVEKVMFSGYSPNPLYEQVCEGIELLKREVCDTILAIGGGSAIDVAKCIKLAVLAKEGKDAILPPLVNTRVKVDETKLPIIAIPTTAGTGSESTHNAVMYYDGKKQTVTNDVLLPNYAILEPSVLENLPIYQKKCTMMDALCQGIESWWSVNSTIESYEYSRQTIALIMQNWERYIFENNSEAAAQVMLAANYSGRAINITQTTAAHAMSYKLTSLYGIPHGYAVAVCLPELWQYMIEHVKECSDVREADYLKGIFDQIAKAMGADSPLEAIEAFRQMMNEMGLSQPTATAYEEDIKVLSVSVNPIRLKNTPVHLSNNDILGLYAKVVQKG